MFFLAGGRPARIPRNHGQAWRRPGGLSRFARPLQGRVGQKENSLYALPPGQSHSGFRLREPPARRGRSLCLRVSNGQVLLDHIQLTASQEAFPVNPISLASALPLPDSILPALQPWPECYPTLLNSVKDVPKPNRVCFWQCWVVGEARFVSLSPRSSNVSLPCVDTYSGIHYYLGPGQRHSPKGRVLIKSFWDCGTEDIFNRRNTREPTGTT
jgi:hypothetical protein